MNAVAPKTLVRACVVQCIEAASCCPLSILISRFTDRRFQVRCLAVYPPWTTPWEQIGYTVFGPVLTTFIEGLHTKGAAQHIGAHRGTLPGFEHNCGSAVQLLVPERHPSLFANDPVTSGSACLCYLGLMLHTVSTWFKQGVLLFQPTSSHMNGAVSCDPPTV